MFEVTGSSLVSGLINGFCLACIYVLIALGFSLIMSIMNVLQFAHGEVYMVGAFITYYLTFMVGVNVFLAMAISMVAMGIIGFIIERAFIRPLLGKFSQVLCVTLGLSLILQTAIITIFGPEQKVMPNIWPGVVHISEWIIPNDRLAAVLVCVGLTVILFLFLKRSRYGQAIMATAQNREGALLQGVNPNLMYALVMIIGCALAAVAGSFAGGILSLSPFMGTAAMMKGILIMVLGGMGSLMGVIVGGVFLGFCDAILPLYFDSAIAVITPLILILILLVVRRQGIFGHEGAIFQP